MREIGAKLANIEELTAVRLIAALIHFCTGYFHDLSPFTVSFLISSAEFGGRAAQAGIAEGREFFQQRRRRSRLVDFRIEPRTIAGGTRAGTMTPVHTVTL